MYLEPLAKRMSRNGGWVYPAAPYARLCDTVILLVDVKGGAGTRGGNRSFAAVHAALEDYQSAQLSHTAPLTRNIKKVNEPHIIGENCGSCTKAS